MRRRRHSRGLGDTAETKPARQLHQQVQKLEMAFRQGKCNAAIDAWMRINELACEIRTVKTSKALDRMLAKYANGVKFTCMC